MTSQGWVEQNSPWLLNTFLKLVVSIVTRPEGERGARVQLVRSPGTRALSLNVLRLG